MSRSKHCMSCGHDTLFKLSNDENERDLKCSECGHIAIFEPIARLVYGRCPTADCSNGGPQYFSSGLCVYCEAVIIPEIQYEIVKAAEAKKLVSVANVALRQEDERVVVGTVAGELRPTPTPQQLTRWLREK